MAETVSPEYLLRGAAYALEQCGVLLRDAALLYRSGSYASAVVLAAFARESLGQWKILLDLRADVGNGKCLSVAEVTALCRHHLKKQRRGMLSVTMQADRDSGVGRLLNSRMTTLPGTPEWKRTDDELTRITQRRKKAIPAERHKLRQIALYVDPIEPVSQKLWRRPTTEITKATAQGFVQDARNDYAIQCLNRYHAPEVLKFTDPELCQALEQWVDRPALVPPDAEPLL